MIELRRCKCKGERSEKNGDVGWRKGMRRHPESPSAELPSSVGAVWTNFQGPRLECQLCLRRSILGLCRALETHKPRGATSSTDRSSALGDSRSRVLPLGLSWDHTNTTPIKHQAFSQRSAPTILTLEPCGPNKAPTFSHFRQKKGDPRKASPHWRAAEWS